MKLIHTTEFFLLFYCFLRRKKKDNSKHVLLLLHSLLDRIFMMLTLLLFAEAGHWLGLNLRHYLWCYQRYWIRKLIDRILHFFSGMRKEVLRIIAIWLGPVLKKSRYFELFVDTDKVRENLWKNFHIDLGHIRVPNRISLERRSFVSW
jgi:hypothetical protein